MVFDKNGDGWFNVKNDTRLHSQRLLDIGVVLPTALLMVDDTTLLECYIRDTWENPTEYYGDNEGKTRMAFVFSDTILDARYNYAGDSIAVILKDSTTYLFSAQNGKPFDNDNNAAYGIIKRAREEQECYKYSSHYVLEDSSFCNDGIVCVNGKIFAYESLIDIHQRNDMNIEADTHELSWVTPEQEQHIRQQMLDSFPKGRWTPFLSFYNSYLELDDTERNYIKMIFPFSLTIDKQRLFFAIPIPNRGAKLDNLQMCLYGYYPYSQDIFYTSCLPITYGELKTIHLTTDERTLVINAGEENQMIIPMHPLPELVEECKAMFFDWQMTDEERYEIYSKIND